MPDSTLFRLQKVLNTAARILKKIPKFSHITDILKDLHWLPIRQRITFKILLLTYQAYHNTGSLKCAVNTRVGVEWEQPLLTKCPNGYAPHTASDSKVLTLPSRGGTVSTNGERRKARHWRSNQLLWTDGVHQLKRQFI